mmetsp:Transcript_21920/g.47807  ORF Transcript_21920/g.47807 Transcript_21920/m.47807 type:complete len:473 (+) Transcript_21920:89-1507(+)
MRPVAAIVSRGFSICRPDAAKLRRLRMSQTSRTTMSSSGRILSAHPYDINHSSTRRSFSAHGTSSTPDEASTHHAGEFVSHGRPPVTSFSPDELMVRDLCQQWADEELRPVVREMDEESRYLPGIIDGLFECGLMGMEIPEQYGGAGMNFTSALLAVEELSRVDPSVSILVDIHNTLTNNAVRFWGSKDLKDKWLPRLATDTVSSFALSEAGSGSDAFAMKTTATPSPDGSSYTINGSKLWISNAEEAGVFLLFANANPEKGYRGITAFMVDSSTEGITVGKPESKLGLRASSTCPVTFEDVKVDSSEILGVVGEGYRYCISILNEGRIGIGAQQLGIAKGCLDVAMPYLMERKQFGTTIGDFQGMQHQYAQIATEIYAAELMVYNTARMKEQGLPFVKEASMTKLYSSQVAEKAASKSIEWLGGVGFTRDLLAEKFYRDCKVGSIYEGTSNMQLSTIAKIMQSETSSSRYK